jgi:hypothetical protein
MKNPSGTLILNGVTDADLAVILETKAQNEGRFTFNPQQMQGATTTNPTNPPLYQHVSLGWSGEQGLEFVLALAQRLIKKEEKAKVQGQ